MEAVEAANIAHQILSAAALVSPTWEATRELHYICAQTHTVCIFFVSCVIRTCVRLSLPWSILPPDSQGGGLAPRTLD